MPSLRSCGGIPSRLWDHLCLQRGLEALSVVKEGSRAILLTPLQQREATQQHEQRRGKEREWRSKKSLQEEGKGRSPNTQSPTRTRSRCGCCTTTVFSLTSHLSTESSSFSSRANTKGGNILLPRNKKRGQGSWRKRICSSLKMRAPPNRIAFQRALMVKAPKEAMEREIRARAAVAIVEISTFPKHPLPQLPPPPLHLTEFLHWTRSSTIIS
mmetsp:Transcript_14674/g.29605  ORF Transcript_14674/g.29605 Transcript_14674/m.29605 type:complete len:213 (+) Transcript_14674:696-1334(+)